MIVEWFYRENTESPSVRESKSLKIFLSFFSVYFTVFSRNAHGPITGFLK